MATEKEIGTITFPADTLKVSDATIPTGVVNKSQVDAMRDFISDRTRGAAVEFYSKNFSELTVDIRRAVNGQNINLTGSNVTGIIDQSFSENDSSSSTNVTLNTVANRVNKRDFLKFNAGKIVFPKSLNLNNLTVTCVYKINAFGSVVSGLEQGLWGSDNGGWDKFICFRQDPVGKIILVVGGALSGSTRAFAGVGPADGNYSYGIRVGGYQTNSDPTEINKIHAITIVYGAPTVAGASSIWVNGRKLATFTASNADAADTFAIGDINPTSNIAILTGDVLFYDAFSFLTSDYDVEQIHKFLQQQYAIATWG